MMPISIHALLAESDGRILASITLLSDFYPRSPCGERRWTLQNHQDTSPISIHALLAESDCSVGFCLDAKAEFLSTLSLRRATLNGFAMR